MRRMANTNLQQTGWTPYNFGVAMRGFHDAGMLSTTAGGTAPIRRRRRTAGAKGATADTARPAKRGRKPGRPRQTAQSLSQ